MDHVHSSCLWFGLWGKTWTVLWILVVLFHLPILEGLVSWWGEREREQDEQEPL